MNHGADDCALCALLRGLLEDGAALCVNEGDELLVQGGVVDIGDHSAATLEAAEQAAQLGERENGRRRGGQLVCAVDCALDRGHKVGRHSVADLIGHVLHDKSLEGVD